MNKYTALIFDVIDSRKINNRIDAQKELKMVVNYLNEFYKDYIKKDVICSAGDEFQGLFSSIKSAYAYARKLQLLIYPLKVRCGIGYGTLNYYVDEWLSTEIDGEAYHYARDAIKNVPKDTKRTIFFKTIVLNDKLINTLSLFNTKIKAKRSDMARIIELLIDFYYPLDQLKTVYNDNDYSILNHFINNQFNNMETKKKSEYALFDTLNVNNINNKCDIDIIKQQINEFNNIYPKNNSYYFDGSIPWGIGKSLALIINTTPQNINQHINTKGVKDSRSIDSTIFNLINDVIEYNDNLNELNKKY